MKALFVYILSAVFVCAVVAFPANDPNDDAETIAVPPQHRDKPSPTDYDQTPNFGDFDGVVISDVNPGFFSYTPIFPYSFNFDIFTRLQDMLKTFRDSAWSYPSIGGDPETTWISNLPDDGKRNTTSTVEIIDGHKVVTNDTVITHKTEFGDAVISIRVVDIEPLNGSDSKEITPVNKDTTNSPPESNKPEAESREELDPASRDNEVSNDIELSKLQDHPKKVLKIGN